MTPAVRKLVLAVHLTSSLGWIGAVAAYLVLQVAATSQDPQTVRAAWIAMDLTGWWALVPLAAAALATGVVISLGTPWGLFRHYWVLISLALTILCTVVLVGHMFSVSAVTARLRETGVGGRAGDVGSFIHPGGGLLILLAITVLNVYKPRGLTPYGWRKQQEERTRLAATAQHMPAVNGAANRPEVVSAALAASRASSE